MRHLLLAFFALAMTTSAALAQVAPGPAQPDPLASPGTTAAPVLSSLKKTNAVLTTTALGASAVFTGAWVDTTGDNTSLVDLTAYSAVGAGTLVVQESSDISGTLSGFPIQLSSTAVSAASATKIEAQVHARYWRVVYTNGATAQTTFEIAYTADSVPSSDAAQLSTVAGLGATTASPVISRIVGTSTTSPIISSPSDSSGNGNSALFTDAETALWNGTAWDRNFYCAGQPVNVTVTAAGTTQLVPLSGTTKIRVCGGTFAVSGGTGATVQFIDGTGTNCGTGTQTLTGAMPLTTATSYLPLGTGGGSNNAFIAPSGAALCIVVAGTTPSVIGYLTYDIY